MSSTIEFGITQMKRFMDILRHMFLILTIFSILLWSLIHSTDEGESIFQFFRTRKITKVEYCI